MSIRNGMIKILEPEGPPLRSVVVVEKVKVAHLI